MTPRARQVWETLGMVVFALLSVAFCLGAVYVFTFFVPSICPRALSC